MFEDAAEGLEGGGEGVVAVFGDVFYGGDGACFGLVEGGAVCVEELVVEGGDECVVDCLFDLDLELGGEGFDIYSDGWLDFVVVAVPGGVVAFAEEGGVLLVGEGGGVEAVCGCKLVVLAEEDGVWLVFTLGGHFDGMVWGEVPTDGVEGGGEEFF